MVHELTQADQSRSTAFLSYSRKDTDFLFRLAAGLEGLGYAPVYDQSDRLQGDPDLRLTAQDEWWITLKTMIAACDVVVLIVSPASAASSICDDEIAYARDLGKRIIPVLLTDIDFDSAPQRLRSLNVKIDFRSDAGSNFTASLEELSSELDTDMSWYRHGARLARLADQWNRDGRPEWQFLRSGAIAEADAWASRRPSDAPELGNLVLHFLDESRKYEVSQRDRQRRIVGRAFVKPALKAYGDGNLELSLRLATAGALLADDLSLENVPELADPAFRAIANLKTLNVLAGHTEPLRGAFFSPDGRLIVTTSYDFTDNSARVWDATDGGCAAVFEGAGFLEPAFSPDNKLFVTSNEDNSLSVWNRGSYQQCTRLVGHTKVVLKASFSPDAQHILSCSMDGTARVWNANDGVEISCCIGHEEGVKDAVFSTDGQEVVTYSDDESVRVWETKSGREIGRINRRGMGGLVGNFIAGARYLATYTHGHNVTVWDVATGRKIFRFKNDLTKHCLTAVSFSPDGSRVAAGFHDGAARIWDIRSSKQICSFISHREVVRDLCFSFDGQKIATASSDGTAIVWDSLTGAKLSSFNGHEKSLESVRFSVDAKHLVTGSEDCTARVWDTHCRLEIFRATGHNDLVRDARFSPNGKQFVTISEDKTAVVWDATNGRRISQFRGHKNSVIEALFSPDGKKCVTTSFDQTARVWDVLTGRETSKIKKLNGPNCRVAYTPEGRALVCDYEGDAVQVWDVEDSVRIFCFNIEKESVRDIYFSSDGQLLATSFGSDTVRVWRLDTGVEVVHLKGHTMAFSPTGHQLVIASHDNTARVRVWDIEHGNVISMLKVNQEHEGYEGRINSVSFGLDGSRVMTTSGNKTISIWCAKNGVEITQFCSRVGMPDGYPQHLCFSPDGKRILVAVSYETACVWDVDRGVELAVLEGHSGTVTSGSFSHDGKCVLTTSSDGSAQMWDVSRTCILSRDKDLVVTAALSGGLGKLTNQESIDLLLQDAPADLFEEALRMLNSERIDAATQLAADLRKPLHSNCYLSPTQYAALSESTVKNN